MSFKKILFITGLLLILFGTTTVFADTYGDYTYTVTNNEITIDKFNSTTATEAIIPSEINGIPVTTIAYYSFYGKNVEKIVIPDSVTTIEFRAFVNCYEVKELTIGTGVKTLEGDAFYNLRKLETIYYNAVNVPDYTYHYSGCSPFYNLGIAAPNGVSLIFGDTVEHIPAYFMFVGNNLYKPEVSSITIGKNVKSIGNDAFADCTYLTSVYTDSIVHWCSISFATESSNPLYHAKKLYINGSLLENLIIPAGFTNIGDYTFYNASCITSLSVPNTVTSIGQDAFSGCSGLTDVSFSNTLTTIGASAFSRCSNITGIYLPNSVVTIGGSAFSGCSSIKNISLPAGITTIESNTFAGCSALTEISIPQKVSSVGNKTFSGCESLTEITINENISSIGDGAFGGCSALKTIYWNAKNVADFNMYSHCFNGSGVNGMEVIFGNSVEHIPAYAFGSELSYDFYEPLYKINVTKVTIPPSVISIGANAFLDCTVIKEVCISDLKAWCSISFENYFANPIDEVTILKVNNIAVTQLVIPGNVTKISAYAFYELQTITSLTLPENLTSIGNYAFYRCKNLSTVYWNSKSVSNFTTDNYIFYDIGTNNENLKIIFGNEVTKIPAYAFENDGYGFNTNKEIVIGNKLQSIGAYSFYRNNLTLPTLPESLTSIGDYAFYLCKGSEKLIIPDSVTNIGTNAFDSCHGIEELTVGKNVFSIGYRAFCFNGLKTVYWNAKKVKDLDYRQLFASSETGTEKIREFIFGSTVEYIPGKLFYDPFTVFVSERIIIGENVTSIGPNAFGIFNHVDSEQPEIYYNGTEEKWNQITIDPTNSHFINAPRNYFYYVNLFSSDGTKTKQILNSINTVLNAPGLNLPGHTIDFFTNEELTNVFSKSDLITGNTSLWYRYTKVSWTETTVSDDGKTFSIVPVNLPVGCQVILGLYKNGELADIQSALNQTETLTFNTTTYYDSYKVMVFNSIDNCVPLTMTE
ncbi:MAG: leucine-rich repeat protein [Clostridia bacterium]|nr:leucine-rich repeat protein [Clostridia bacterium]